MLPQLPHQSQKTRQVPLRLLLVVPFSLQIMAAVGVTGWLSFRNEQTAINNVASQLRSETGDRIKDNLDTFTKTSYLASELS